MTPLILSILVVQLAGLLLMVVWASVLRMKWKELSIGLGFRLFSIDRVTLRLIPLGGYLAFHDANEPADAGMAQTYQDTALWKKLVLGFAPTATLFGLSAAVLGARAWQDFLSGLAQIGLGAISPLGTAQALLSDAVRVSADEPFIELLALTCAKVCACTIVLFPVTAIGSSLLEALRVFGASVEMVNKIQLGSILIVIPVYLSWLLSIVVFVVYRIMGAP